MFDGKFGIYNRSKVRVMVRFSYLTIHVVWFLLILSQRVDWSASWFVSELSNKPTEPSVTKWVMSWLCDIELTDNLWHHICSSVVSNSEFATFHWQMMMISGTWKGAKTQWMPNMCIVSCLYSYTICCVVFQTISSQVLPVVQLTTTAIWNTHCLTMLVQFTRPLVPASAENFSVLAIFCQHVCEPPCVKSYWLIY